MYCLPSVPLTHDVAEGSHVRIMLQMHETAGGHFQGTMDLGSIKYGA